MQDQFSSASKRVKTHSRLDIPCPWFRFYPERWQGSRKVQRMTFAERGLYFELLCECWTKGGIPDDASMMYDSLGIDGDEALCREVDELFAKVKRCFAYGDDGMLVNTQMEEVRAEINAYRMSRSNKKQAPKQSGNDNDGSS